MNAKKRSVLVGIAGGSGSGKGWVAERVRQTLAPRRCTLVQQDSYYADLSYLPLAERQKRNYDHPNAVDFELLAHHVSQLLKGLKIEQPSYDFKTHSRCTETWTVLPGEVIILEGILVLHSKVLRVQMDLSVFVDTREDMRLLRRLQRDIVERGRTEESVMEQYQRSVRPMHYKFVEPSKQYADMVINGEGENSQEVAALVERIQYLLSEL